MEGKELEILDRAVRLKTYEICTQHDADDATASKVAIDVSRVVEKLVNAGHKTSKQLVDEMTKNPATAPNKASDECSPSGGSDDAKTQGDESRNELNSFLKFVLNFPIDTPQGERTLWGVIRDNRNLGKSIGVFTEDVNGRDYLFIYPSDAAGYFGATHHVTSTDIARVLLSTQIAERCNIRLGKFTFNGHRIPVDYILANVELKEVAETSEPASVQLYCPETGFPLSEPSNPMNGESPDAMRSVEGLPPDAPHNPLAVATIPVGTKVKVIPLKSEAVGTVTWSLDGLHTVKFSDDSGDFHLQRMPYDTLQVVDDAKPLSREKVINSLTVAAQLANGKPLRIAAKMVESILHHLTH